MKKNFIRTLAGALALSMAVTLMPAVPAKAEEKELPTIEELCEIADQQLDLFIDDEKYLMYRTGNNLKEIIPDADDLKKYGMVAEEWDKDVDNIVPKLLLNKDDKKDIGQQFLLAPETKLVGIAEKILEDSCFVITIFSKEEEKEEEEKVEDEQIEEEKPKNQNQNLRAKKPNTEKNEKKFSDEDLTELRMAFELFDPEHTETVKVADIMHAMDAMDFKDSNPILYNIVAEFKNDGTETISWDRFSSHIAGSVNDRETDQGLEDMYGLIIDEPNTKTIKVKELKKIGNEVGVRLTDEEAAHILENTTDNGEELAQKDFNRFMKK